MEHQHHHQDHQKEEPHPHGHMSAGIHSGHGHLGHASHDHNQMIADFRNRFFVVLALTIPILLLSQMIQHWMGIHLVFSDSGYVLFALSTVVFFCTAVIHSCRVCFMK